MLVLSCCKILTVTLYIVFNHSHFNHLYILIFHNKKDPTYDNLYEFNVYTDTLSKFMTHTEF